MDPSAAEPLSTGPVIEDVRVRALSFPTPAPESDGTLTWDHTGVVVVEIVAGGVTGLGWTYSAPSAAAVVRSTLRGEIMGRGVRSPALLWERMHRACRNLGTRGVVMAAISAVDIALWDLHARLAGQPLASVWGRVHDSVPVYGSGGFTSLDDGQLETQVHGWLDSGCDLVKIKIGQDWGHAVARDLSRVELVRTVVDGRAGVMTDANGGYSREQARQVGERLDHLDVVWFEEPVSSDDAEGLRQLADELRCDVAAGEYIAELADAQALCDAVDCLQLDVTRCGGYTGWRRCAAYAHEREVPISAHCAPALHLPVAMADNGIRHIEWFADHVELEKRLINQPPPVVDGRLHPQDPAALGHGYTLKDDLDAYDV